MSFTKIIKSINLSDHLNLFLSKVFSYKLADIVLNVWIDQLTTEFVLEHIDNSICQICWWPSF